MTHTLEHFEHLRIGCRYWNFNRLVHVRMTLDLTREGYPFRKIGPRRKLSPLTFRAVTCSAVWKGWRPTCQKVAKSWLWLACQQKDMDSTGTRVAILGMIGVRRPRRELEWGSLNLPTDWLILFFGFGQHQFASIASNFGHGQKPVRPVNIPDSDRI